MMNKAIERSQFEANLMISADLTEAIRDLPIYKSGTNSIIPKAV
jgi:hypothetical protein